jgi:ornithine cyclodeaminase/alanine dehydrogenase-like protein (mu-crystallin family)
MRVVDAAEIDAALTFPSLIEALRLAFAGNITVPVRHHHTLKREGMSDATHLLMPAWTQGMAGGDFLGTKVVNVFPDNGKRGLPSINGTYLLMSGETGETLAAMDGTRLTVWRTAAASALAASFLARPDASHMVMIGAGALAPFVIRAHHAVRPLQKVTLWNRRREASEALAEMLAHGSFNIAIAPDAETAVRDADIISCATLSSEPLVRGAWLKPGAHLDLIGAYSPGMRESDDESVMRSQIYVDTKAGAMREAGDIVQPLATGVLTPEHIRGDLFDLCRASTAPVRSNTDITLFKSVGTAIEDLAAAMLVWRVINGRKES